MTAWAMAACSIPADDADGAYQVCHNQSRNLRLSSEGLQQHLDHGDQLGSCAGTDRQQPGDSNAMTICHEGTTTMTVADSGEMTKHMAHGDSVGACT